MLPVFLLLLAIGQCMGRPQTIVLNDDDVVELTNLSISDMDSIEWSGSIEDVDLAKRDLVVTKDNVEANLTQQQTFLLTDIISKVETSLVQYAADIVSAFKTASKDQPEISENATEIAFNVNETTAMNSSKGESSTLYVNYSAGLHLATPDVPAHVSIDRVAVYIANAEYFPEIPTFAIPLRAQIKQNEISDEDQSNTDDHMLKEHSREKRSDSSTTSIGDKDTSTQATTTSSTSSSSQNLRDVAVSTTTKKIAVEEVTKSVTVEAKGSSTTIPPIMTESKTITSGSTTASTPITSQTSSHVDDTVSTSSKTDTTKSSTAKPDVSTTPKNPIKVLKETEEELKEKIAEIEAEPVILSARV